jgi:predicted secreted protein
MGTACLLVLGAAHGAAADSLSLEWDPSGETVGYKVHVGMVSGSYTQHYDVGPSTTFTFPTATAGQRYCFAVSAYALSSMLEGPNSAEVCGYSNEPPTLVNPGNRTSTVGQPVTLQLVGSDPASQPLTYSATGLPPGLSLMPSTGYISGAGTTGGSYSVTARASDSVLTASQTFTWVMTAPAGDTTRPTATITTPTSGTTHTMTSSTMSMGGTASDNVGVTQVTWATDRGFSGVAGGTTNWSVSGISLVSGANVITVTAVDAAGNQGTDTLTVTYTAPSADTTRPTASINTPTNGPSYSTTSASINMSGTAADNVGVTQVRWTSDRGNSGVATGTTGWSVSGIPLFSGSNVISVTAVDAAGNAGTDSLSVTVTVPTAPPSTVTLVLDTRKASKWRSTKLTWSNAPWPSVDVYRNDMLLTNTPNNGSYTDPIWNKGTFTYRICAVGSTTSCSNTASVFF